MRIAIIYVAQETNDFNPLPTTLQDYEAFGIFEGQAVIDSMQGAGQVGGSGLMHRRVVLRQHGVSPVGPIRQ